MSSPAIAAGVISIGSCDKYVSAIAASSGNELWKFATLGGIFSSPMVSDGMVDVDSLDDRLYALGPAP